MNAELKAVQELQEIVEQLYELTPLPRSARPTPSVAGAPEVHDVLAGLGYLVALQKGAPLAGAGDAALEVLQSVVHDWLAARKSEKSEAPPAAGNKEQVQAMSGFYARTSEHILRLGGSRKRSEAAGRAETEATDPFQ